MVQMHQCAGCGRPILDQFIHSVLEKTWHRDCIKCTDCHCLLTDRCYSREGKLYCKSDFLRRFGPKCQVCLEQIHATEFVRQSQGCLYHLKCFTCSICLKQLSTGEEYYLTEEGRFICKEDHTARVLTGHSTAVNGTTMSTKLTSNFSLSNHVLQSQNSNETVDVSDHIKNESESDEVQRSVYSNHNNNNNSTTNTKPFLGNTHDILLSVVLHNSNSRVDASNSTGGDTAPCVSINTSSSADLDDVMLQPSSDDGLVKEEEDANNNASAVTDSQQRLNLSNGTLADDLDLEDKEDDDAGSLDEDLKSSYSDCTGEGKGENDSETGIGDHGSGLGGNNSGTKRRGPRTTIKAKQLDTLKAAFAATPKPTRHVREQLAQETGLSMRVIQVWFQNRRSKERRMKQLNAMGPRRAFFRNPRRMRTLRGGLMDDIPDGVDIINNPAYHGYFPGNHPEFYNAVAAVGFVPGGPYPNEFFHPGQGGPPPAHFLSNIPVSMSGHPADQGNMHGLSLDQQFYPGPEFPPNSVIPSGGLNPAGPPSPNAEQQLGLATGGQISRHHESPFHPPAASSLGSFLAVSESQSINMEAW